MCLRIVEVYSVCLCVHHIHAVDSCRLAGQRGHVVEDRVFVIAQPASVHTSVHIHADFICTYHLAVWMNMEYDKDMSI
ncbi:hypothetical protein TWF225_011545 [Orbilia oligospora]|uniref:Uncharacterized protein n=1 Tax=Orbilia oligospora TaxID=2813651 RepID=A0A7C8PA13_ORBOL|nr:hypothetical protein TWF751_011776 [Orbilia oligospora]KAF3192730.1 hypothetical protein TWF225_011545 [Orbilia oligospora]KAF3262927.1 hypothetical protein TWF217_004200 [Orbilia oligospora]KAF3264020.1 hypothetical protein TWF128_001645 [Orbilia oligospora]KAF3277573.1 hypothetical protein TWF132_001635 [Orbilia oligospora]